MFLFIYIVNIYSRYKYTLHKTQQEEADKITIFIRDLLAELRSLIIPQRPTDWLSCIQAALTAVQA